MPIEEKIKKILCASIEEDQNAVATQWANTFSFNLIDDIGTQISQLLLACVAKGDFKTRPCFSEPSAPLEAPYDGLTIADYLSHGSRIILDYQALSDQNRAQFLTYFSYGDSRASTHAVIRDRNGIITELKGKRLGLWGQLPASFVKPRDFGVNIAIGGEGQFNFAGDTISSDGYSGHLYFHHNEEAHLLMAGIEQSKPPMISDYYSFWINVKEKHDQFKQAHSCLGHSDTYTAAGSLYFSNPIYGCKFFLEKGYFPPDKYGAMQVTITDNNWLDIMVFVQSLRATAGEDLKKLLLTKPSTATNTFQNYDAVTISNTIKLDFKAYLTQVYDVFIEKNNEILEKQRINDLQDILLTEIQSLKTGNSTSCDPLFAHLTNLIEEANVSPEYKMAISRIETLFKLKVSIAPNLPWPPIQEKNKFADLSQQVCNFANNLLWANNTNDEIPNVNKPNEVENEPNEVASYS